jgi:hypothetical protein
MRAREKRHSTAEYRIERATVELIWAMSSTIQGRFSPQFCARDASVVSGGFVH